MCYAFPNCFKLYLVISLAPLTASSKRTRLDLDSEGSEADETGGSSSDDASDDDTTISNTEVDKHTEMGKVF